MNVVYLRHSFLDCVLGNELVDHHLVLLSEAVSTRKGLKFKYSNYLNTGMTALEWFKCVKSRNSLDLELALNFRVNSLKRESSHD